MSRSVPGWPAAAVLLAASWLAACGAGDAEPERPVWGFSSSALVDMDLEGLRVGDYETLVEGPEIGCQQVLTMRIDRHFPGEDLDGGTLRELLEGASWMATGCEGSCDGEVCKTQHMTAMANRMQTARTRCTCQSRDEPPCAFTVEWEIGNEARRRIRSLECVVGEGHPDVCDFRVGGEGREMILTCGVE